MAYLDRGDIWTEVGSTMLKDQSWYACIEFLEVLKCMRKNLSPGSKHLSLLFDVDFWLVHPFANQIFFNLKLLQDSWNNQLMISSFSRQLEGNMVCHLRRKNHMIRWTQAEETQRAIEEAESTSAGASEENMRSDNFFHHWRLFKYVCKRHVSKLVIV